MAGKPNKGKQYNSLWEKLRAQAGDNLPEDVPLQSRERPSLPNRETATGRNRETQLRNSLNASISSTSNIDATEKTIGRLLAGSPAFAEKEKVARGRKKIQVPKGVQYVDSSNVKNATYDEDRRELTIIFLRRPNWKYVFYKFPKYLYIELLSSASKGKFYNARIRDRFRMRRMN